MFSPPLRRINSAKQISEEIDLALRNSNKIKIGVSCVAYLLRHGGSFSKAWMR